MAATGDLVWPNSASVAVGAHQTAWTSTVISRAPLPAPAPAPPPPAPPVPDLLWLDAADAATLTLSGGINVDGWADKSVSNNDASLIAAGNAGTLQTDKFGLGAVQMFGGQGYNLSFPFGPSAGAMTFFMVFSWVTNTPDSYSALAFFENRQVNNVASNWLGAYSTALPSSPITKGSFDCYKKTAVIDMDTPINALSTGNHLVEMVLNPAGTDSFTMVDGVVVRTLDANWTGVSWTVINGQLLVYLGLTNQLAEVQAFDSVLSAGDRTLVRNSLISKWGL